MFHRLIEGVGGIPGAPYTSRSARSEIAAYGFDHGFDAGPRANERANRSGDVRTYERKNICVKKKNNTPNSLGLASTRRYAAVIVPTTTNYSNSTIRPFLFSSMSEG